MNFQPRGTSATPLFKSTEILKLNDHVNLQNFLFAHDSLKNNLPSSLMGKLSLVDTVYNTRNETHFQLNRPRSRTILYGSKSIKSKSVDIWNSINKLIYLEKLHEKSRSICQKNVKKILLGRY